MAEKAGQSSTVVLRTRSFPADLLNEMHPHHRLFLSTKPHTNGCHVRKAASASTRQEVQELNLDVIVGCYLDAKYYQHDHVELTHLVDVFANFANLFFDSE